MFTYFVVVSGIEEELWQKGVPLKLSGTASYRRDTIQTFGYSDKA